MHFYDVMLNR